MGSHGDIAKKLPPGVLLKLLSILLDICMALTSTGVNVSVNDEQHTAVNVSVDDEQHTSVNESDNDEPYADFITLLLFDLIFVCVALILIVIKIVYVICAKETASKGFTKKGVIYDCGAAIMGFCFLTGDNLTDEICRDFGSLISDCRKASVTFIGVSTILNFILLLYEKTMNCNQGWKELDSEKMVLAKTFSLLPSVIIFNSAITGLHESVFKLTTNETILCPPATHVSGSLIYCVAVVMWIVLLVYHCWEYYKEEGELNYLLCFVLICIGFFFAVYIFADTPWPWNCFDADETMKEGGSTARLVLMIISLMFIITFSVLYIFTVCIPFLIGISEKK